MLIAALALLYATPGGMAVQIAGFAANRLTLTGGGASATSRLDCVGFRGLYKGRDNLHPPAALLRKDPQRKFCLLIGLRFCDQILVYSNLFCVCDLFMIYPDVSGSQD